MTPEGDSVARVTDLRHRYGDTKALDGVSLDLQPGRMLGLIGPDGVGKSTLLALLAGARQIQDGTVTVLGGSMADKAHREAVFHRIAYMTQGLGKNLYQELSVCKILDCFGRLFGHDGPERRRRIDWMTRATGLDPFLNRPAGKLSGGMKQNLGLCCGLINDPDFLILDGAVRLAGGDGGGARTCHRYA
jgi:ribosome-dependent ATPase